MPWNLNLGSLKWPILLGPSVPKKRRRSEGEQTVPKRRRPSTSVFKPQRVVERRFPDLEELKKITNRDQELTKEAPMRWRPDITPDDQEFTDQLAYFKRLLEEDKKEIPLENILNTLFSPQERRLLTPVTPGRNPRLAKIQEDNRKQYHEILKSDAFKDQEDTANIAFKLTLAYFGIPTEPIYPFNTNSWDGTYDDDDSDGEAQLPLFPPRVRNARFANKYYRRLYAYDHSRVPDPLLEAYYALDDNFAPHPDSVVPGVTRTAFGLRYSGEGDFALGLRGGGGDDSTMSLRGGAGGDNDDDGEFDYYHEDYKTTLDGEDVDGTNAVWMTLFGYQGQVAFKPSSINTFVDAVDRLLCLDCRAGIVYKLYMRDRRGKATQKAWKTKTVTCKGVGNFEADKTALEWINEELPNYQTEEDQTGANMVLFVTGPSDPAPSRWEPNDDDRVLKFELLWHDFPERNRPDLAYLRIPANLSAVEYTNQYGPWMTNICRVLAPGWIPQRPGRPAIPDAFISLKDFASHGRHVGSYGGLVFLPQLWEGIVRSWNKNPKKSIQLNAVTEPKDLSDRILLFLPGDNSPYGSNNAIKHSDLDKPKVVEQIILDLVKRSMSKESYSKLEGVAITVPGEEALLASTDDAPLILSVSGKKAGKDKTNINQIVTHLKEWSEFLDARKIVSPAEYGLQMYPQFLALHPVFSEYSIRNAQVPANSYPWNPNKQTLKTFRDLAKGLLTIKNPKSAYIELRQNPVAPEGKWPKPDKPKFIIGPDTTEEDWLVLRDLIVEPDVYVTRKNDTVEPVFGTNDKQQPFGFFDIYSTPREQLYVPGLEEDEYPKYPRYHDYQMREENASAKLPTRKPEGKARQKADKDKKTSKTTAETSKPTQTTLKATQAGHSLDFLGNPSFTGLQKAVQMREYTYFHPLDVHVNNSIPIHAPPLDNILNIGKDSTPKISLGVLTPTETRRLKRDYFNLRQVLLDRTQLCPYSYAGCKETYGVTQKAELHRHLNEAHNVKEKCPFCDDPTYPLWSTKQRGLHIATAHPYMIQGVDDQSLEGSTLLVTKEKTKPLGMKPPKKTPENKKLDYEPFPYVWEGPSPLAGEEKWHYCARCGRDHHVLNEEFDRRHHDHICYVGALDEYRGPKSPGDWQACTGCGGRTIKEKEGKHDEHLPGAENLAPYCMLCGVGLAVFDEEYRKEKHYRKCEGYGSDRNGEFGYCPFCKEEFGDGGEDQVEDWIGHVMGCKDRPKKGALGGDQLALCRAVRKKNKKEKEVEEDEEEVEKSPVGKEESGDEDYVQQEEEEEDEEVQEDEEVVEEEPLSPVPAIKSIKSPLVTSLKTTKKSLPVTLKIKSALVAQSSVPVADSGTSVGVTTRSKSGTKTPTTWKVQAKSAGPTVTLTQATPTKKKRKGTLDMLPVEDLNFGPDDVSSSQSQNQPGSSAGAGAGRRVSFNDVVEVQEIESIETETFAPAPATKRAPRKRRRN